MSTFDEMVDFIKSAWPSRSVIVPCLVGSAGIGKTAAVKQAASELGSSKVVTIIASQILPNEVSGITMPVVESKAMEIFDHYRLSSLKDGDILFFDELLEADQLVLSACLTLIESRELMSGRKLPDIMIVAATNPTIKPNMLKENIRQRFVWRKFNVDKIGCTDFIERKYGINVEKIARYIVETGEEYNILSPRSLTKMVEWICSADSVEKAKEIARQINTVWNNTLGTELLGAYVKKFNNPIEQTKRALKSAIEESGASIDPELIGDDFKQDDIVSIMEMLQQLPEWNDIAAKLSSIEVEDVDVNEVSF